MSLHAADLAAMISLRSYRTMVLIASKSEHAQALMGYIKMEVSRLSAITGVRPIKANKSYAEFNNWVAIHACGPAALALRGRAVSYIVFADELDPEAERHITEYLMPPLLCGDTMVIRLYGKYK